jgi:hypothetical protein
MVKEYTDRVTREKTEGGGAGKGGGVRESRVFCGWSLYSYRSKRTLKAIWKNVSLTGQESNIKHNGTSKRSSQEHNRLANDELLRRV